MGSQSFDANSSQFKNWLKNDASPEQIVQLGYTVIQQIDQLPSQHQEKFVDQVKDTRTARMLTDARAVTG